MAIEPTGLQGKLRELMQKECSARGTVQRKVVSNNQHPNGLD